MRPLALPLMFLLALAACSGVGSTSPNEGAPCPVAVTDTQARLSSPPAGATGVSPSIGSLTFTYGLQETPTAYFTLAPSDGSPSLAVGTITNNVTVLSPGVATMTIPPLKSGVTYSVSGSNVNFAHLVCFRYVSANLGSFTTR